MSANTDQDSREGISPPPTPGKGMQEGGSTGAGPALCLYFHYLLASQALISNLHCHQQVLSGLRSLGGPLQDGLSTGSKGIPLLAPVGALQIHGWDRKNVQSVSRPGQTHNTEDCPHHRGRGSAGGQARRTERVVGQAPARRRPSFMGEVGRVSSEKGSVITQDDKRWVKQRRTTFSYSAKAPVTPGEGNPPKVSEAEWTPEPFSPFPEKQPLFPGTWLGSRRSRVV